MTDLSRPRALAIAFAVGAVLALGAAVGGIAEALGGDVARWLENPTLDPLMTEEIAAN